MKFILQGLTWKALQNIKFILQSLIWQALQNIYEVYFTRSYMTSSTEHTIVHFTMSYMACSTDHIVNFHKSIWLWYL